MEFLKGIIVLIITIWLLIEGSYFLKGEDKGVIEWILRKLGV